MSGGGGGGGGEGGRCVCVYVRGCGVRGTNTIL